MRAEQFCHAAATGAATLGPQRSRLLAVVVLVVLPAQAAMQQMPQLSHHQLSQLLVSLGRLGARPPPAFMARALACSQRAQALGSPAACSPLSVSCTLAGVAMMGGPWAADAAAAPAGKRSAAAALGPRATLAPPAPAQPPSATATQQQQQQAGHSVAAAWLESQLSVVWSLLGPLPPPLAGAAAQERQQAGQVGQQWLNDAPAAAHGAAQPQQRHPRDAHPSQPPEPAVGAGAGVSAAAAQGAPRGKQQSVRQGGPGPPTSQQQQQHAGDGGAHASSNGGNGNGNGVHAHSPASQHPPSHAPHRQHLQAWPLPPPYQQHGAGFTPRETAHVLYALALMRVRLPAPQLQRLCDVVERSPGLLEGVAREGRTLCQALWALGVLTHLSASSSSSGPALASTHSHSDASGGAAAATSSSSSSSSHGAGRQQAALPASLLRRVAACSAPHLKRRYTALELALLLRAFAAQPAGAAVALPPPRAWMVRFWWRSLVLMARRRVAPAALCSQLSSLARLRQQPFPAWWRGAALALRAALPQRQAAPWHLSMVLWHMARARHRPAPRWSRQVLLAAYGVWDQMQPDQWAHMLGALARLQVSRAAVCIARLGHLGLRRSLCSRGEPRGA